MRIFIQRPQAILIILLVCILATAPAFAQSSIFEPTPMPETIDWQDIPPPERMQVTTDDGLVLQGYRWRPKCERHVAMVFFHGNSGNRFDAAMFAAPLLRDDVDLIVASYRGYGDNPGDPNEQGLYADAEAFFQAALQDNPDRTFVFGFSLGGALAVHVADRYETDGLVTLGTFTRLRAAAPRFARAFIPDWFRSIDRAPNVTEPWLILHGTEDRVVRLEEAETLVEAAGSNATLIRLTGAPHRIALDQISGRLWQQLGSGLQPEMHPEGRLDAQNWGELLAYPPTCAADRRATE